MIFLAAVEIELETTDEVGVMFRKGSFQQTNRKKSKYLRRTPTASGGLDPYSRLVFHDSKLLGIGAALKPGL